MSLMREYLTILEALLAAGDELRQLLGDKFPSTRARLVSELERLTEARDRAEVFGAIDNIIAELLDGPASHLMRNILRRAGTEAGYSDTNTRSAHESGSATDVPAYGGTKPIALGGSVDASLIEVIGVGQQVLKQWQLESADTREAVPTSEAKPSGPEGEKSISAWIGGRSVDSARPLTAGDTYILNFKVGNPVENNLFSGPETQVNPLDIPEGGLNTEWVVNSSTVEITSLSTDAQITCMPSGDVRTWSARFPLRIPKEGESSVAQLKITPRASDDVQLDVLIYVSRNTNSQGKRELYRQFVVKLAVETATTERGAVVAGKVAAIQEDLVCAPASQLNLRTTHEWTTPPGELTLAVFGQGLAHASGDVGQQYVDSITQWFGVQALVAGPIQNVRSSAEKFRAKWENYLNDLDPDDLTIRLQSFAPQYDWASLTDYSDSSRAQTWETVRVSPELRDLAYDGHSLYEAFFPPGSQLRSWIDSLTPGQRINISWLPTSGAGWMPHIPWGLMYQPTPPAAGVPIDAMGFMGLRYRINYTAHPVQAASKALGSVDEAHGAYLLYWGNQAQDITGAEARWQQQQLSTGPTQIFVPAAPADSNMKGELLRMLDNPGPSPVTVIYLFCQCSVGEGNDPVLRFGSSLQPVDVVKRTELGRSALADRPLVFANACTTAAADPYIANELEVTFFNRGCRGYLGTESKVPITLASRFAFIFFNFFYRKVDPQPMAAGEAVAQTRLFLWTNYKNIGGLLYSYINQYELFMASSNEVATLRS